MRRLGIQTGQCNVRLPVELITEVRVVAHEKGLRPCHVIEQLLRDGLPLLTRPISSAELYARIANANRPRPR